MKSYLYVDILKPKKFNGLLEAMKTFELQKGIIITDDHLDSQKHDGLTVDFVPLWLFLLKDG